MPHADSGPRGPVEPPVLEAQAPDGWWNESAAELFGAAKNISSILHEASECGADLMTPLVGFCAFNAAYMNLYIFRFPQMNLCRSPDAELHLDYCLSYLEDFQHQWSIGESWVSLLLFRPTYLSSIVLMYIRSKLSSMLRNCTNELLLIRNGTTADHELTLICCTKPFMSFAWLIGRTIRPGRLRAQIEIFPP